MRSKNRSPRRTPVSKLCDIFANLIETSLTEKALGGAPCQELSRCQWAGTLFIQRHHNCSIRELAEGLGVSHPAAVKMVERLVRKGLVDRHESSHDRRVVELNLSTLGARCVEHVREQRARALEQIMAEMSQEETEALLHGLQAFLHSALADKQTVEAVCLHCGVEHAPECLVNQAEKDLKSLEHTGA